MAPIPDQNPKPRAAVTFADEPGIGSLTMRKLGEALGVEAMSLYKHVASRHYPSRSGPTSPPARCCDSWNRSRGVPSARLIQASMAVILRVAAGEGKDPGGRACEGHGPGRRWFAGGTCTCPGWLIGMTATTWGYRP